MNFIHLLQNSTSKRHPDVETLLSSSTPFFEERKAQLNLMWQRFSHSRLNDEHFVDQFVIAPSARYWELLLGCLLLEANHRLINPRIGPDFKVAMANGFCWIEAITPTRGDIANPDRVPGDEETWRMNSRIEMRLTGAIHAKLKAHKDRVGPREPFVIAINGYQIGKGCDAGDAINALFGIGDLVDRFAVDSEGRLEYVESYRKTEAVLIRQNGSFLSKEGFLDRTLSSVSSIIYGSFNVNWPMQRARECIYIIRNPTATNPLPTGWFGFGEEVAAPFNAR